MKTNIKEIKKALNKIGYKIKGAYPNRFIYDNNGVNTNWRISDEMMEGVINSETQIKVWFYFKGTGISFLDKNTLAIGTKEVFTLLKK